MSALAVTGGTDDISETGENRRFQKGGQTSSAKDIRLDVNRESQAVANVQSSSKYAPNEAD